jgi:hypothetical protein
MNATESMRKCTKSDLIGTWTVAYKKLLNKEFKNDFSHLLMPTQILIYKKTNELRSLYSSKNDKNIKDYLKLLSFPQYDSFEVKNGIVGVLRDNKLVDMYKCDYLIQDIKDKDIKKGQIMQTRLLNGKLAIVNLYKKIFP